MSYKDGSENLLHSFDIGTIKWGNLTCPSCGEKNSLEYKSKDIEIDEDSGDTVIAEGLVCNSCGDLFMQPEEGARILNEKAVHENNVLTRFLVLNGEIVEQVIH